MNCLDQKFLFEKKRKKSFVHFKSKNQFLTCVVLSEMSSYVILFSIFKQFKAFVHQNVVFSLLNDDYSYSILT